MGPQLRNSIHFSRPTPLGEPGKSIATLLSDIHISACIYVYTLLCINVCVCARGHLYV